MKPLGEYMRVFFDVGVRQDADAIACLKNALIHFCNSGKKGDAFTVYFCFCEIFEIFGKGYDTMSKLLEFLSDHEYHSGELLTKHRDHYSHSVYVFALGLALYANDAATRRIFSDVYGAEFAPRDFLYAWGLTSLFHDIGYPFQLAHEQIKVYAEDLWGEGNPLNPYVSYENMDGLLALSKEAAEGSAVPMAGTVNELLASGIHFRLGYPSDAVGEILENRYKHQRRFMDHGYFSAVLLTHRLSLAGKPIRRLLLDVLTAIALHNSLNRYDLRAKLGTDTAIPPERHPLAYLLVLCDELQNWDRTAFGSVSKKDPLAWKAEFSIAEGEFAVRFYFDNFCVIDTADEPSEEKENMGVIAEKNDRGSGGGQAPSAAEQSLRSDVPLPPVAERLRLNKNVEALQNGKFVSEILSLVLCHTRLSADAAEERKEKQGKTFASSDSFINLCDFARAIHASYRSVYGGGPFEQLPLEFKVSNIEQAKSYADKLELINCFYSDKELDYPIVRAFASHADGQGMSGTRDDLGFLAREEHLRWVREKLDAGWKYGTDYSSTEERNAKKIHRCIVPFDVLPEEDRRKDELMVRNMVPFLYRYGHGVRIYSYRYGTKPVLDIAGCGHRTISMHDEGVREQIKSILRGYQKKYRVVVRTNFAFGADQMISECANELGITIKAALPLPYEEYIAKIREDAAQCGYTFTDEDELRMRHLLAQAVSCKVIPDEKYTYLEASKYIIGKSRKLIVLWDGVRTLLKDEYGNPVNQGGTYHNICIARTSRGLGENDIHIIRCERRM